MQKCGILYHNLHEEQESTPKPNAAERQRHRLKALLAVDRGKFAWECPR